MTPDVSAVLCRDYSETEALMALREAIALIDGLSWVKPGMTIAIKANLVTAKKPEAAATTHPALLCALVRLLQEKGARAVVGDSPGGPYTAGYLNAVYRTTGLRAVEEAGGTLNHNFEQETAHFPEGVAAKSFQITSYLKEADGIINFCKLKTHGMMGMSAAAKNMFGAIPGTLKPEYHLIHRNAEEFADHIVDIDEYFKPQLHLVDGVMAMEGNGPTMGTPRYVGLVAASHNPHALDLFCAGVIGRKPKEIPTLYAAMKRGLVPESREEISVIGSGKDVKIGDFQNLMNMNSVLFTGTFKGKTGELFGKLVQKALGTEPKPEKSLCTACGKCQKICPAKAITIKGGIPRIQKKLCIRCFCCQEFCPTSAMQVKRAFVARVLDFGKKK